MNAETTVDAYLEGLQEDQRAALERLRTTIRAAAPGAVEVISYQMPAFKLDGRLLVSFAAFKDHCSLFPMSKQVIEDHRGELGSRVTGKGTISFAVDAPLPAALVRKIVKARIAENEARRRRSRRDRST